jgi:hypothetical protein
MGGEGLDRQDLGDVGGRAVGPSRGRLGGRPLAWSAGTRLSSSAQAILAVLGNALEGEEALRAEEGTTKVQLVPPDHILTDIAQDGRLALDGLDLGEARQLAPGLDSGPSWQVADPRQERVEVNHAKVRYPFG